MKLSVCISVHNTAKYLNRCLDSVIVQELDDIEIVLVNNGSTDNSGDIMKDFKNEHKDKNISIYEQEDRGLAQGRQTGIDHAKGDYITFLDADDYLLPGAYRKLYEYAVKNDLDVAEMQTKCGDEVISSGYTDIMKCDDLFKAYCEKGEVIPTMLWMRIYRRNLFDKPVLPKIYMNNEDYFAFPCLMLTGGRIGFVNEVLHVYSIDNDESVMTRYKKDPSFAERFYKSQVSAMGASKHVHDFLDEKKRERYKKELLMLKRNHVVTFLFRYYPNKNYSEKMNAVINVMEFENEQEVCRLLKEYSFGGGFLNKLLKVLSVKNVHRLVMLKVKTRGAKE